MIRYHEEIIHHKKKRNNVEPTNQSNILYVEGISKNINDIKVHVPNRRDKIQD